MVGVGFHRTKTLPISHHLPNQKLISTPSNHSTSAHNLLHRTMPTASATSQNLVIASAQRGQKQLRTCAPHPTIGHDKNARGEDIEQHLQGCWRMHRPRVVLNAMPANTTNATINFSVCYCRWEFVPPMRKRPSSIAH